MNPDFFSSEGISNSLSEFKYDPDHRIPIPTGFRGYETIFTKRSEQWLDEKKKKKKNHCYSKN